MLDSIVLKKVSHTITSTVNTHVLTGKEMAKDDKADHSPKPVDSPGNIKYCVVALLVNDYIAEKVKEVFPDDDIDLLKQKSTQINTRAIHILSHDIVHILSVIYRLTM